MSAADDGPPVEFGAMALDVSVVVPSHQRPIRLLWCLNALAEQTLAPERWEVVLVHDSDDETDAIVMAPPPPGARRRTGGWGEATAPLVASTDDDTRAEPDWLERLLAVAERSPGAIVQGR